LAPIKHDQKIRRELERGKRLQSPHQTLNDSKLRPNPLI
jgi:hypothetical protein